MKSVLLPVAMLALALQIAGCAKQPGLSTDEPPPCATQPASAPASFPATQPADTMPTPGIHVVKAGETFWNICCQHYGQFNTKIYRKVLSANPGLDVRNLKAGQRIVIPE